MTTGSKDTYSDATHAPPAGDEPPPCCSPAEETTCCDTTEKSTCCGPTHGDQGGCGCRATGGAR